MTTPDQDAVAAALIQLATHAERITGLDDRETSRFEDTAAKLRQLSEQATATQTTVDAITRILRRHASAVKALSDLDHQVTAIASQVTELADQIAGTSGESYDPVPAPRWWLIADAERQAAVERLRAWVKHVYKPGYGHLAAGLPPCWEHHQLCLYTLDWLSELWSALYLGSHRTASTLAAQAEWQTRLMPAAAAQMTTDATNCRHPDRDPTH